MTTIHQRYWQAIRAAHRAGARAAAEAKPSQFTVGAASERDQLEAYEKAWRREIWAFGQLEAMRRPLPNQAQIDVQSVTALRGGEKS